MTLVTPNQLGTWLKQFLRSCSCVCGWKTTLPAHLCSPHDQGHARLRESQSMQLF